jgi:hypothetical protein
MDQPAYPTFRSTSLSVPTSIEPLHLSGFVPENVSAKRDSTFMVTDGPITPPLSPGGSEDDAHRHALPPDAQEAACLTPIPHSASNMQHNKGSSLQVLRPVAGSRRASREALQSEERMEVDARRQPVSEHATPPMRHLEDEQSHVQKGGPLRLTDFEVKGTLGESLPAWSRVPLRF